MSVLSDGPRRHTRRVGRRAAGGSARAALVAMLVVAGLLSVGSSPALAAPTARAYVTNQGADSVSVIDTATNTVIATIPVGSGPRAVAVSPDGTRAYVTNLASATVSVIDTATNTVIATIPVGSGPRAVAVSPDGARAYVANQGPYTVSVIDTATNTVIETIPVGNQPSSVAVSPDGTRAYVANPGSATVSVIDTATNTVIATIAVGSSPQWVAVSPDGTRAYVASPGAGTVSVIDTATSTVTATIPVGSSPRVVAVSPDGTRAYVANFGSGTVSVIDTATSTVIATILAGSQPQEVAVSPDGSRAYVTNVSSGTVSVIDTATNTVIATIAVGISPFGIAVGVVDIDAPTVTITSPADGAMYTQGQSVIAHYACADEPGGSGLDSCAGTVADGAAISTATLGAHAFSVTATDEAGHKTTQTATYTVQAAPPSATYGDEVAGDGPLVWYRLGEGSAQPLVDSAHAKNGACVNGVTFGLPGAVGGANTARGFDGRAAYCYANGITAPTAAYTIEGWMKLSAPKAGTIAEHGSSASIYVTTSGYCMKNAWEGMCWPSAPTVGVWHHVAASWSTSDKVARLYVDGVLRMSAVNGAKPSGASTFYVGYGQNAPWFTGSIDEVAYYPTRLSDARVVAHYHAGCGC
jgi:YVTN family beta-propeller protein